MVAVIPGSLMSFELLKKSSHVPSRCTLILELLKHAALTKNCACSTGLIVEFFLIFSTIIPCVLIGQIKTAVPGTLSSLSNQCV